MEKNLQVLRRIRNNADWLQFSQSEKRLNFVDAQVEIVSKMLNVDDSNIKEFWFDSRKDSFEETLKCFLEEEFQVNGIKKNLLYDWLASDSIIPDSLFIKSFVNSLCFSATKNSEIIASLYLDSNFHSARKLVEKNNLFQDNQMALNVRVGVLKENSLNHDSAVFEPSEVLRTGSLRRDNLILIGTDSLKFVDLKVPADAWEEKIIGALAVKHDGIHVYEVSNDHFNDLENSHELVGETKDGRSIDVENLAVRLEGETNLLKGLTFDIGNNFLLQVNDVKGYSEQLIQVKLWKRGFNEVKTVRIHFYCQPFEVDGVQTNFYVHYINQGGEYIQDISTFDRPVSIKNTESDIIVLGLKEVSLNILFDYNEKQWKLVNQVQDRGLWKLLKNPYSSPSPRYSGLNLGFGSFTLKYSNIRFLVDLEH